MAWNVYDMKLSFVIEISDGLILRRSEHEVCCVERISREEIRMFVVG